jgi:hypothetical protein
VLRVLLEKRLPALRRFHELISASQQESLRPDGLDLDRDWLS